MRTKNTKLGTPAMRLAWMVASAIFPLLVVAYARSSFAQESQPKTFSSAGEASDALFQAAQNEDEEGLETILGAGKEVTSSSDEVEDKLERERFIQKYQEMHRLVREPDGSTVLYIGAENWPFPIPLVSKNGAWYFDSKTGLQEIKFRRVGENEATAIQVCDAFVIAKKLDETKATGDDPISQYVQSLVTGGAANVDHNTGANLNEQSNPFHGYYFRVVKGNSASRTHSYVSGKKTSGLALLAYPAEYGSSGVMTFLVTRGGAVYEKDLGPRTATVAHNIRMRDSSWHAAE